MDARRWNHRKPHRVTINMDANEQLLYFTSTSLLADDRGLVFISDATGHPNLFYRDLCGTEVRQLTFNAEGFLKSYVYFDGSPYRGLGKASVSLDPRRGLAYYLQGREIRTVDMMGHGRVLAEYPAGQMTAFTHLSADGRFLCVPTTDERALDGGRQLAGKPTYDIDARVQGEHLNSYLRIYDANTGAELAIERVPDSWITHVQFSPLDPFLVLYNHEWPSDCGIRRMWLWDGSTHQPLRPEGDGCSRKDWTCHELWERDGSAVIYHGTYADGRGYLGRVTPDGARRVEIPFPPGFGGYGHFTGGAPGMLVSDGYYKEPGEAAQAFGEWISVQRMDWAGRRIEWIPLCRSGSSWNSQDCHPHPIFNHAGDEVYFTSDRDGRCAIYRIPLGGGPSSPSESLL